MDTVTAQMLPAIRYNCMTLQPCSGRVRIPMIPRRDSEAKPRSVPT